MSRYSVMYKDHYICYGWDPVFPMRTFFLQVESLDESDPEELLIDIGQGAIFGDAYTDIGKFLEVCTQQLQKAGIDFELSQEQQFQLLDDMLFV